MISIGIVEDQTDVRESLDYYFSLQNEILTEISASSIEEFLAEEKRELEPDVLLLDIDLPGLSGIRGIPLIKKRYPQIQIIMLTVYKDAHKIFESLKAGACGYLVKTTPLDKIKEAIIEVNNGGSPMSPVIARKVIEYFDQTKNKIEESILTPKEQLVVTYLVDGKSYKKIAESLGNSIDTVRTHIRNIYRKLEVSSKSELVAKHLKQ